MNILKSIQKRISVRTYSPKTIDAETIKKIETYINNLEVPFGAKCRIKIIHTPTSEEPIKLGTYGFIKGAKTYIVLSMKKGELAEEAAAYIFEQVVLYCTSLGLGTCWLGLAFSKSSFGKAIQLGSDEILRIVSPLGYASDKSHFSLFVFFGKNKSRMRKPFTTNFFNNDFATPLTENEADIFAQPLEMVRLAPSAKNKQSWRIVKHKDTFHFYKSSSYGFDSIDLGIAMCHFEQSCLELGIKGQFEILREVPKAEKASYVISWTRS